MVALHKDKTPVFPTVETTDSRNGDDKHAKKLMKFVKREMQFDMVRHGFPLTPSIAFISQRIRNISKAQYFLFSV